MTRYFFFERKVDTPDRHFYLYTPVDHSGTPIVSGLPLASDGPFTAGLAFPKGRSRVDLISCMSNELCLSPQAAEVFRIHRSQPGTRFFPVTIVDSRGSRLWECVCVYFSEWLEVLDMEKSTFRYYSSCPDIPCSAIKGVLSKRLLESVNADLVHVDRVGLVCSESLKHAIEDAGLTNFAFTELPVA